MAVSTLRTVVGRGPRHWRLLLPLLLPLLLVCLLSGLVPPAAAPARADIIPEWSSPVQLVPGRADHQTRLLAQDLTIRLEERGPAVVAVVHARYTLLNDGPDTVLPVGYVTFGAAGGTFSDVDWSSLRAFDGGGPLPLQNGEVHLAWETATQSMGCICDWVYWDLPLAQSEPTSLEVVFEQRLSVGWTRDLQDAGGAPVAAEPWVLLTYDFAPAVLWHAPMAQIRLDVTANDGGILFDDARLMNQPPALEHGQFIPPRPLPGRDHWPELAGERSPSRLTWQYEETLPDWELGAVYVPRATWQPILDAHARLVASTGDADSHLHGVAAIRAMIGSDSYLLPAALLTAFPEQARAWAWRATALAPDRADAWDAAGHMEFWRVGWFYGPACWPTEGARALEQAKALGSADAAAMLAYLEPWMSENLPPMTLMLAPCNGPPDAALLRLRRDPDVLARALRIGLEAREYAWGYQDRAALEGIYAGAARETIVSEADRLQDNSLARLLVTRYPRVERADFVGDDVVILAVRYLVVSDTLVDADGRIVRQDANQQRHEQWRLEIVEGAWHVVVIDALDRSP